jgi:hypothetical protein
MVPPSGKMVVQVAGMGLSFVHHANQKRKLWKGKAALKVCPFFEAKYFQNNYQCIFLLDTNPDFTCCAMLAP